MDQHEARTTLEYWGLPAICRRMRWRDSRTPVRQALKHGFPLYLKRRPGQRRQMYYSNEKLIKAWEWSRCEREIARLVQDENPHLQEGLSEFLIARRWSSEPT
ncbi:hypothetical protein [Candidatus Nitrospira bockiana]